MSQALTKLSLLPDRLVVKVELEGSVANQERCVCCPNDLCLICVFSAACGNLRMAFPEKPYRMASSLL